MQVKLWMGLGLAAMTAGCSQEPANAPDAPAASTTPAAAPSVSGEGEGGVDAAAAATDPVAYLSALAVAEAHVRAAQAALVAGERQAAAEMLAHPVSEVLADMAPTFARLGVATFDQQLIDASGAVLANAPTAEVNAKIAAAMAALDAAAAKAPTSTAAPPLIRASVIADQIDRAARQYGAARQGMAYEPYLDGVGFFHTARALREQHGSAIGAASPDGLAAIDQALAGLARAYPDAARPKALTADPAALVAASSAVQLAL